MPTLDTGTGRHRIRSLISERNRRRKLIKRARLTSLQNCPNKLEGNVAFLNHTFYFLLRHRWQEAKIKKVECSDDWPICSIRISLIVTNEEINILQDIVISCQVRELRHKSTLVRTDFSQTLQGSRWYLSHCKHTQCRLLSYNDVVHFQLDYKNQLLLS